MTQHRRRLSALKLTAIAAVDNPCQEGARAAIMKRAECEDEDEKNPKSPEGIAQKFLNDLREQAPQAEEELAKLISKKDTNMDLEKRVGELEAENATLKTNVTAAEKRATDAEAALATEKTAHAETKKSLVDATDEVIKVGTTEMKKSEVGEATFAMAKTLADDCDLVRLEKRAGEEFSHLPTSAPVTARVLKAIEEIADEDVRKAAEQILTAAEKTATFGFSTVGTRGGAILAPSAKAAENAFEGRVQEIVKRDNCSELDAMRKAREEFPAEFEAFQQAAN